MLLFQQGLSQNLILAMRAPGTSVLHTKLPFNPSAPQIAANAYISGEHHLCCSPIPYSTQFAIKAESSNIFLYLF